MATTATIPIISIPIGTLAPNNSVLIHPEWARFLRDLQVRSGGVAGVITVPSGGTGFSSYTAGDTLYADTTTSLARLNPAAVGNALLSGAAPSWGKVGLTTHVSGVLPETNGGTGFAAFGTGVSNWLQAPSSANLAIALTDETGTGVVVFNNGPTFVAPVLGTPASGTLSNCTGYPASALTGTVAVAQGGTGITSGTSGGVPYYSSSSTIASSVALTANAITLGGGAGSAPASLGSLGTTTTVLHGNAAGAPTFGAVSLTADVSGTLPVANGGTGITSFGAGVATFLGTPSSANLAAALTDETGSGANVFANTPTLVTPVIGAATGTSVNLTSTATASGFVPTGSSAVSDGMYLRAANTLGWSISSSAKLKLSSSALAPSSDNGLTLGESSSRFSAVYAQSLSDAGDQLVGSSGATSRFGYGSGWTTLSLATGGTARLQIDSSGQVAAQTAGAGLSIKEGSNCKQGVATMVAGTVTVANTSVTASSRIFLTPQNASGTAGSVSITARVAATSFTIGSTNILDTRDVAYLLMEPA